MSEKLSDSIVDMAQRGHRFHEESARLKAEQAAQGQHQRDRQARHRAAAMQTDEEMKELIYRRILRAQEEAKLQSQPDVPPVPVYTARQDEELELEQAAGRRALAKYAQRSEAAAAARERIRAEEEAKEIPGLKIGP